MVQPIDPVVPASSTVGVATPAAGAGSYIHWGAAIAGGIVAAAISVVLMAFGAGIGLSISSPSPTWRNATAWLALLSGVWILVVAVGSSALGGYIAGRMRARLAPASSDEVDFRDGMHGALAWAIAALLATLLVLAQARMLAPAFAEREGGAPGAAASAGAAEPRYFSYEVDRMLRGPRAGEAGDLGHARAEVGRLLAASLDERTYTPEDRAHLVRLVAARTGLAAPEAERRVDTVVAQTREKANRARRSAVITAFMAAASLALGLAVAWFAACAGGRHRDGETVPSLTASLRAPRISVR
jgi:hypothetical protein